MLYRKTHEICVKEELEQCPFCGSQHIETIAIEDKAPRYSVWCFACEAEGPNSESIEEAILRWNQRTNYHARTS